MTLLTSPISVTPFPVVIDGVTCERDDIIALCTDVLVDAALNEGGDPFDPDPNWLGPNRNAEGFRLGDERVWVVLGSDDLAEAIARAEADLQQRLGYVPKGRHRSITFAYREREFDIVAMPAENGQWATEIFELMPPEPEFAEMDGRIGRGWPLSHDDRFATPGLAVGTAVAEVIDTVDADAAEAERRAGVGRPKR